MNWIPVTERLPEPNVRVFVLVNGTEYIGKLNDDAAWNDAASWAVDGWYMYPTVTHWMPIPPHPLPH